MPNVQAAKKIQKRPILRWPKHSLSWLCTVCDQCDQIGLLLKGLGDKRSFKSSRPNVWQLLGLFLKTDISQINLLKQHFGNFCTKLGYFLFQHLVTVFVIFYCASHLTIQFFLYMKIFQKPDFDCFHEVSSVTRCWNKKKPNFFTTWPQKVFSTDCI